MFPKWQDWDFQYTRKGILKQRMRKVVGYATLAAAIIGAYKIRNDIGAFSRLPDVLWHYIRYGMLGILRIVNRGVDELQSKI